jgi:chloramphenicol 3-O phosphotransferase
MTTTVPRGVAAAAATPAGPLPDVIMLNGASSAGKSSLTAMLQARLSYIRMGIDDFIHERAPASWYGAPEGLQRVPGDDGAPTLVYGAEALKLWRAFHRSVRVCVDEGLRVIVDDAIVTKELLDDWLVALAGVDVFFVGVHCAAEELALREIARRDRVIGTAVGAMKRIHAGVTYDLEVDSTATVSSALAAQVIAAMSARAGPSAFERMAGGG